MTKDLDFEIEELGIASSATKGTPGGVGEPHALLMQTGISDSD